MPTPKVQHIEALGFTLGQQDKPRRMRRPSLKRQIAAAEASGKQVTSITTADGIKLTFGESTSTDQQNEWDTALSNSHGRH